MSQQRNYGSVTPHLIGLAMKEMVRRVIISIRKNRFNLDVSEKKDYDGNPGDIVTSADKNAQDIYIDMIRENFPGFGVVAEEENLKIEPEEDFSGMYFTVDPLDGTKAFVRNQSHGIGTMIALVCDEEVISAYVGDVMTEEIYGYRPESDKVHQISGLGHATALKASNKSADNQFIALRQMPEEYSEKSRRVIKKFKGATVERGSIGTHASDLWKGVVGALLLEPGYETPWDTTPIVGISKKIGFRFYKIDEDGVSEVEFPPSKKTEYRNFELLIAGPEIFV